MNRQDKLICVVLGVIFYKGKIILGDRDICDVHGTTYTYCDSGYHCCDGNTKCCADGVSSATVIGIVFAALFFISICVFCAILVTKKKKFRPNQLVRPVNNTNISTVGQTNSTYSDFTAPQRNQNYINGQFYSYGQPPYGHSVPYTQTPIQPPPYSQTDALSYPPPPEYKLEP